MENKKTLIPFVQGDKMGLATIDGDKKVEAKYPIDKDGVQYAFNGALVIVRRERGSAGWTYDIYNPEGELLHEACRRPSNYVHSQKLLPIGVKQTNDEWLWGFIGKEGQFVVSPKFYDANFFSKSMSIVKGHNGLCGLVNEDGKLIVECLYESLEIQREDRIHAVKNDKHGFIDQTGNVIIPLQYDKLGWFSHLNTITCCKDDKWGLLDYSGNIILPNEYDYVGSQEYSITETRIVVGRKKNKTAVNPVFGLVDWKGNVIIPFQYRNSLTLKCVGKGFVHAWINNNKDDIYDFEGNLLSPEYDLHFDEEEQIAYSYRDGILYDADLNVLAKGYKQFNCISEGIVWAKDQHNKWGALDCKTGKTIIPHIYADCYSFKGGVCEVRLKRNGKSIWIDKAGNEVAAPAKVEKSTSTINYITRLENGLYQDYFGNIQSKEIKPARKPVLYFDMDGVLVDFNSALNKQTPETLAEYKGHEDDIPGLFAQMDPMPGAIEAVHKLTEKYDCYILSTAPWANPSSWADKVSWVTEHLDDVFHKKVILTHHKNMLNDGKAYLIDDRTKHGAEEFGKRHIHFGSQKFPDWLSVLDYLEKDN